MINNIKKKRISMNLTQQELSEKIGISRVHLSRIENNVCIPSAKILRKLENELEWRKNYDNHPLYENE